MVITDSQGAAVCAPLLLPDRPLAVTSSGWGECAAPQEMLSALSGEHVLMYVCVIVCVCVFYH